MFAHYRYSQHGSIGIEDQRERLLILSEPEPEYAFIERPRLHGILVATNATSLLLPRIDFRIILHLHGDFSADHLFCITSRHQVDKLLLEARQIEIHLRVDEPHASRGLQRLRPGERIAVAGPWLRSTSI